MAKTSPAAFPGAASKKDRVVSLSAEVARGEDATMGESINRPLPSRDWILLPLLFVLTSAFLAISTELIARHTFSESQKTLASCLILDDAATGPRGEPNTTCKEKNAEARWIETRFDSCGYRNDVSCAPKQPGIYRIVMTGSSVGLGERVQREESFAAVLPVELSRMTGRPVELYNESMGFGFARNTDARFEDVLKQKPDLILWPLTPSDIDGASFTIPGVDLKQWNDQGLATKAWRRVLTNLTSRPFSAAASEILGRTRAALMFRHYLYQSQSEYVKSALAASDQDQGFLKAQLSPEWQKNISVFATYAGDIETRAQAAGVPFVAFLIPNHAQTAMISSGEWPLGYDPYKLDAELKSIIDSHGGSYLEISKSFEHIPDPGRFYLPVDGHPNPQGHTAIAGILAHQLTSGVVPALRVSANPAAAIHSTTATEQEK